MKEASVRAPEPWAGRTIVLAVAFGLIAGLAELVLLGVKKFGQHRILRVSRDVIWMAPLTDVLLCLAAATLLLLLAWRLPRLRGLRTAVTVIAFPAFLTILLHYRPVHIAAKAILALGLAVQAGLMLSRSRRFLNALLKVAGLGPLGRKRREAERADVIDAFSAGRRRFLMGAATMLGGLALGTRGWIKLSELRGRTDASADLGAPNVLLIVLDTVRAESLSLYGYDRGTSPQLDQRAVRGVVFDRAYSTAPWTLPSHVSMFTGRWHHEMSADFEVALDNADPTLAEVLGAAGYATGGFVANTAYGTYEHGLNRGFAHYEDYRLTPGQIIGSSALGSAIACGNQNEIGCKLRGPVGWNETLGRKPAEHVARRFLSWLDGLDAGQPFFAFLNLFDAHTPYLPPSPYDTAFAAKSPRGNVMHLDRPDWEWTPDQVKAEQNAYDGAIAYVDAVIGSLLDDLERRGVLADTLVIITSDHGEEFMEHGVMTHGNSLYSPSLHIPLVLLQPGKVPSGVRVAEPVSIRDLPATISELAGVRAPFAGASLSRYWHASPARSEPLYAQVSGRTFRPAHYPVSKGDMRSVISGDWHYIRRGDGQLELFDMRTDPWERRERSATETSIADSLARLLNRTAGENH